MLRLHQLRLPLDAAAALDSSMLRRLCAERLSIPENTLASAKIQKRSIDARDKSDVHFSLTADVTLTKENEMLETKLAAKFRPNEVAWVDDSLHAAPTDVFHLPLTPWPHASPRPVVVGAGPAGLFCALALAARGAKPILLERGQPVQQRVLDVEAFEQDARLNEESNVLFGEGGAGAFSDGKLTCGLNSPHIRTVLETLCACGAPEDILTAQRPHIGTDELRCVLHSLRKRLVALGADVRFGHKLTGIVLQNGQVAAVRFAHDGVTDELPTDTLCLAIGHSARDTYRMLFELGLPMEQKPFAIGVRIEHLQRDIDRSQYGAVAGHPALPPAEYKLSVPTPDQRGVYTFCMCPGGQVIGACSEQGGVNVNGMSLHARNGKNANAAVLVGVMPADFGSDHPLAGMVFQQKIERAAFAASGGYAAPCQRVGDFLKNRPTAALGSVRPSYLPGVSLGEISGCLPSFVTDNLRYALPKLAQRLRGFDAPDALLTAPETRSSSPLRMLRNEQRQSPISGLYPLGEGAGHAGGIISAAMDGLAAGMTLCEEGGCKE
ncbi:MAG: FAD-binding protein [Clostridia bacterium]